MGRINAAVSATKESKLGKTSLFNGGKKNPKPALSFLEKLIFFSVEVLLHVHTLLSQQPIANPQPILKKINRKSTYSLCPGAGQGQCRERLPAVPISLLLCLQKALPEIMEAAAAERNL